MHDYTPLHISKKSRFRKRETVLGGDDEVVQDPYVDQLKGGLEPLGDPKIRLRRFCNAARMVVNQDHSGRIEL